MAEKYPHDALVRAWLDGKTIQYLEHIEGRNVWLDMDGPGVATKMPHFYPNFEHYRVKPAVIRYRVALVTHKGMHEPTFTLIANNLEDEHRMLKAYSLVRWLTDWTEVVV